MKFFVLIHYRTPDEIWYGKFDDAGGEAFIGIRMEKDILIAQG